MKIPDSVPEKGFYYHRKHTPESEINFHAYEVVGVGLNSGDTFSPEDENVVIYRPLYEESIAYANGKAFFVQSLDRWIGEESKDGVTIKRFTKITDPDTISRLTEIRYKMYQ